MARFAVLVAAALALCCCSVARGEQLPQMAVESGIVTFLVSEDTHLQVITVDSRGQRSAPQRVVTEDFLKASLATLQAAMEAHVSSVVESAIQNAVAGDNGDQGSALVTRNELTEAGLELTQSLVTQMNAALSKKADASAMITTDQVQSAVDGMLVPGNPSKLLQVLMSKADYDPDCACVSNDAIPSIVAELDDIETDVANLTTHHVGGKYCHSLGLILNTHTRTCFMPERPVCSLTVPTNITGANAAYNCTGKNIFGADACEIRCANDYNGSPILAVCSETGQWVTSNKTLACTPKGCTLDVASVPSTMTAGNCTNLAAGASCSLACAAGLDLAGSLTRQCIINNNWSLQTGSCNTPTNCKNRADGFYILKPGGASSPETKVYCSNGWMIIDPSIANWAPFFNGFVLTSNLIYTPTRDSLIVGAMERFVDWFKLPVTKITELGVSEDCRTVKADSVVYYASGNYVSCNYYNRNCDMLADMTCRSCVSPYGTVAAGTCTHWEQSPYTEYPWETCGGCCHWWNNLPSVGSNGRFCVAYRPA